MKKDNYLTIKEFSNLSGKRVETIRKRAKDINGSKEIDGEWYFLEGSRYPYPKRKYSKSHRYEVILKAIFERSYIDETYFHLSKKEFDGHLKSLEKSGLIEKIEVSNSNGANSYITTYEFEKNFNDKKKIKLSDITAVVSLVISLYK